MRECVGPNRVRGGGGVTRHAKLLFMTWGTVCRHPMGSLFFIENQTSCIHEDKHGCSKKQVEPPRRRTVLASKSASRCIESKSFICRAIISWTSSTLQWQMHAFTRTGARTHIHTSTNTKTHTHTPKHTCTHIHTQTYAHTNIHQNTHTYTHTHTNIRTYTHTPKHTHVHTYTHTHA
jgi:hypothetical protein